jgi:hypothetical protein
MKKLQAFQTGEIWRLAKNSLMQAHSNMDRLLPGHSEKKKKIGIRYKSLTFL